MVLLVSRSWMIQQTIPGGALGLEYLFNFDQQIVFEFASVQPFGNHNNRTAQEDQYAFGLRYQKPLDEKWIIRADAIFALLENADDLSGIRFEVRRKF